MLGASGAIYGLIGLLLFMRLNEELEPVGLKLVPQAFARFFRNNVAFLLLLGVGGLLAGFSRGVAWEAHLGGFLLGFSIGPWILPVRTSASCAKKAKG